MSNDWIDAEGFRANVGIILADSDGKLMLAGRAGSKGWQFPQGGMLEGEEPEEAMYRELREEVGLVPGDEEELRSLGRHVCHHSYIEDHVWFFEWAPRDRPSPTPDRREIVAAEWVHEAELHHHELWPPLEALLLSREES